MRADLTGTAAARGGPRLWSCPSPRSRQSRFGSAVRVGTVDRFQGLQGHVVIYSMGRQAETAGDVPFLYEVNSLNVALSRAKLLVVVIAHSDADFPPVAAPSTS